jgi:hypothetical protein
MARSYEKIANDCCRVANGWSSEISAAQIHATYWIKGVEHGRICHDSEVERCSDCGVEAGQLHVPGCEQERCPACQGQVISCECHYGRSHGQPAA